MIVSLSRAKAAEPREVKGHPRSHGLNIVGSRFEQRSAGPTGRLAATLTHSRTPGPFRVCAAFKGPLPLAGRATHTQRRLHASTLAPGPQTQTPSPACPPLGNRSLRAQDSPLLRARGIGSEAGVHVGGAGCGRGGASPHCHRPLVSATRSGGFYAAAGAERGAAAVRGDAGSPSACHPRSAPPSTRPRPRPNPALAPWDLCGAAPGLPCHKQASLTYNPCFIAFCLICPRTHSEEIQQNKSSSFFPSTRRLPRTRPVAAHVCRL